MKNIRLLIIDESMVRRDVMRSALSTDPDIDIVGVAPTGKLGLDLARLRKPTLVIVSDGITDIPAREVARSVAEMYRNIGVLFLVGSEEAEGTTIDDALSHCIVDHVGKPEFFDREQLHSDVLRVVHPKVRAILTKSLFRLARHLSGGDSGSKSDSEQLSSSIASRSAEVPEKHLPPPLVLIGLSTGGTELLGALLPALPADLAAAVVVVLHMPRAFTTKLAASLNERSAIDVREARDGQILVPGNVFLAPGGRHLLLRRDRSNRFFLTTNDDPPVNGCKPSVDVFFRSVARIAPEHVIALILTGMGEDGVCGLSELKSLGAHIIAQDESSSVVWGMPGNAVRAGVVDEVLPLSRLAERIVEKVGSG